MSGIWQVFLILAAAAATPAQEVYEEAG